MGGCHRHWFSLAFFRASHVFTVTLVAAEYLMLAEPLCSEVSPMDVEERGQKL